MRDDKLKAVARLVYSAFHINTDESWEKTWNWHTDPENVARGGEWSIIVRAREIIALLDESVLIKDLATQLTNTCVILDTIDSLLTTRGYETWVGEDKMDRGRIVGALQDLIIDYDAAKAGEITDALALVGDPATMTPDELYDVVAHLWSTKNGR